MTLFIREGFSRLPRHVPARSWMDGRPTGSFFFFFFSISTHLMSNRNRIKLRRAISKCRSIRLLATLNLAAIQKNLSEYRLGRERCRDRDRIVRRSSAHGRNRKLQRDALYLGAAAGIALAPTLAGHPPWVRAGGNHRCPATDKSDPYTLAVLANFAIQRTLGFSSVGRRCRCSWTPATEKDEQAWWSSEETGVYSSAGVWSSGHIHRRNHSVRFLSASASLATWCRY